MMRAPDTDDPHCYIYCQQCSQQQAHRNIPGTAIHQCVDCQTNLKKTTTVATITRGEVSFKLNRFYNIDDKHGYPTVAYQHQNGFSSQMEPFFWDLLYYQFTQHQARYHRQFAKVQAEKSDEEWRFMDALFFSFIIGFKADERQMVVCKSEKPHNEVKRRLKTWDTHFIDENVDIFVLGPIETTFKLIEEQGDAFADKKQNLMW